MQRELSLHIGELARRAGTSVDTVRYYERCGLLGTPGRTAAGYRRYHAADLGRLQFIRRAKLLGFSLTDIRGLLGLAEEGDCRPRRRQVAELLQQKIAACDAKLAELTAFRQSLAERYQLAGERQDEPACGCAVFPATCACLPVSLEEVLSSIEPWIPLIPSDATPSRSLSTTVR